jgi:hypothetical protein
MSKQRKNESAEVEARWAEFWRDHQNFDSPWARTVLHMLSEFLPFVFKFDAVRHGIEQLYKGSGVQCPADWEWSEDWTDADEYLPETALRELPIFQLALALDAYAYYGLELQLESDAFESILLDFDETPRLPGWLYSFPRDWAGNEMKQTITAAIARRKLDDPKRSKALTPEELAALARVSRKSIMNLLSAGKVLQKDSDDRITVESAMRWLLARPDFRSSIRQRQAFPRKSSTESSSIEPIFVPVANDGSWFSPADRHEEDSSYYVDNGGIEKQFKDYWQALEFVTRASSPRWRYTDSAGRSRIKAASSWERKGRKEVDSLFPPDTRK